MVIHDSPMHFGGASGWYNPACCRHVILAIEDAVTDWIAGMQRRGPLQTGPVIQMYRSPCGQRAWTVKCLCQLFSSGVIWALGALLHLAEHVAGRCAAIKKRSVWNDVYLS